MWEGDFFADVSVVLVTLQDLGLVGGKVRTDETERGGVVEEPYGHAPFVAGLT